jgi:outer membrane lipoprotein-sorting protein
MNRSLALRAALTLLAAAECAPAQSVDQLLARLDQAAVTFRGAKADIRRTSYTASIGHTDVESGFMLVRRAGPGKLEFLIDIAGDNANVLAIRGQTVEHYLPAIDEIQVYDFKKYRDLAQKLLALGFGMSGRDLAANYAISNLRRERVGGRPVAAVDLAPKSQDVAERLKKVELWISDEAAAPAQQKLYFRDGNTWTIEYSNVQLNPKLPSGAFDLPKGAKRVKVQ